MTQTILPIFDSLRSEAITLNMQWKLYRSLFAGPSEERIIMNLCAPSVFGLFQSLLFDDCIMRLCRLTDPPAKGKYEYLSIRQLVDEESTGGTAQLWPDLPKLLDQLDLACQPLRIHRNIRIAHSDLTQVTSVTTEPLPDISIQSFNSALKLLSKGLNCVEAPLRRSTTFYSDVLVTFDEDTIHLMQALRLAYTSQGEV